MGLDSQGHDIAKALYVSKHTLLCKHTHCFKAERDTVRQHVEAKKNTLTPFLFEVIALRDRDIECLYIIDSYVPGRYYGTYDH
jgi:hypothetical protein